MSGIAFDLVAVFSFFLCFRDLTKGNAQRILFVYFVLALPVSFISALFGFLLSALSLFGAISVTDKTRELLRDTSMLIVPTLLLSGKYLKDSRNGNLLSLLDQLMGLKKWFVMLPIGLFVLSWFATSIFLLSQPHPFTVEYSSKEIDIFKPFFLISYFAALIDYLMIMHIKGSRERAI